jgi:Uma2 family endonuclease
MALVNRVMRPRVSYSDLCQQSEDGRRYELYDGEVFVVPSPLPLHQIVVMNIEDWLRHHPRTRQGATLAAPLDIVFSDYDVAQPDVLYFEPERLALLSNWRVTRVPPDLAVEVLSRGTASNDRGRKMRMLARYGVRECWVVDPESERVEVYSLKGEAFSLVQEAAGEESIVSPLLGPLGGVVSALFHSPLDR